MNNTSNRNSPWSRRILSISTGNLIQAAGMGLGYALLWESAQPGNTAVRVAAMISGYLLIYFTSHSSMHYVIGKLMGIQFNHYSAGGSSHASTYPPVMRAIFDHMPFFAAHTDSTSMKAAHPYAKALMFIAGITGTVVFCTAGALFAYHTNTPGGSALLAFNIIWLVSSLIAELRPGGDLTKASKELKG